MNAAPGSTCPEPTTAASFLVVDAVLERDDRRLAVEQRRQPARRLVGVVRLDGEEDDVTGADLDRVLGRRRRDLEVPADAAHAKAARADGPKVCTPGDQVDVGAGARQTRAEVAADAARSEDGDFRAKRMIAHPR